MCFVIQGNFVSSGKGAFLVIMGFYRKYLGVGKQVLHTRAKFVGKLHAFKDVFFLNGSHLLVGEAI